MLFRMPELPRAHCSPVRYPGSRKHAGFGFQGTLASVIALISKLRSPHSFATTLLKSFTNAANRIANALAKIRQSFVLTAAACRIYGTVSQSPIPAEEKRFSRAHKPRSAREDQPWPRPIRSAQASLTSRGRWSLNTESKSPACIKSLPYLDWKAPSRSPATINLCNAKRTGWGTFTVDSHHRSCPTTRWWARIPYSKTGSPREFAPGTPVPVPERYFFRRGRSQYPASEKHPPQATSHQAYCRKEQRRAYQSTRPLPEKTRLSQTPQHPVMSRQNFSTAQNHGSMCQRPQWLRSSRLARSGNECLHRLAFRPDKHLTTNASRLGVLVVPILLPLDCLGHEGTGKICNRSHVLDR